MPHSAIDPTVLREHLRLAEQHIAEGERHIARQREIVAQTVRGGHDSKESRDLLALFEQMQALHVTDRDRLLRELAAND